MKEPFLMNPHVGIINHPKRKKGKKSMAKRRSSKAHMAYVRSFKKNSGKRRKASPRRNPRRKRAQRNPYAMPGIVMNPRRRRSYRKNSPKRHRRRSHGYSRNPRLFGIELPPVQKVLFAGVGFVAPPMIEGFVSGYIPASIQSTTVGKYVVRIGIVAALGWAIGKFLGREKGNMALIGGGVYVATTAAMEFVPSLFGSSVPVLPSVQLPGTQHAYVASNTNIRAYVQPNQRINNSLGAPGVSWGTAALSNTNSSGAVGGTAARFNRY